MKLLQFAILSTLLLFLGIFCTGCSESSNKEDVIVVGTSADNPPYEFIQEGKITGFDIDLIEAIAAKLGKKVVIKNLDFHGLIAALTSNNIDLVIAGLSPTPEREAKIDFTRGYIGTNVTVLYRTKDSLKSANDLKNKIVGAQLGTTWDNIAKDLGAKLDFKVHSLSNNLMLVEELRSKVIDAVILEQLQAKKFIANNTEFASFNLDELSSKFAIALPKNSPLKEQINKVIEELEKNGTMARLKKKWLE